VSSPVSKEWVVGRVAFLNHIQKMQRVPTEDPSSTIVATPPQPQPQPQPQPKPSHRRLSWFFGLALISFLCFCISLYFALYILNTDDWLGWSSEKRNLDTGEVHLTRLGLPRSIYTRNDELTDLIVANAFILVTTLTVLAGALRIVTMPVCSWKRAGYAAPPRSLGRLVVPNFYHEALRDYNSLISTGTFTLSLDTWQETVRRDTIAHTVVALENFDMFRPVLSPRQLLTEMRTNPSFGDHAFQLLWVLVTIPVQIGLGFAIGGLLGDIDLNAENPNQVVAPFANETTWFTYPPAGQNAATLCTALIYLQLIITLLMTQLYGLVAVTELSEKGYCWKRFDFFMEIGYGNRVFNSWPGPKWQLWHELAPAGVLAYDISDIDIGGDPRAWLILSTFLKGADGVTPSNKLLARMTSTYTAPMYRFFQCAWADAIRTLDIPIWKKQDLIKGVRFTEDDGDVVHLSVDVFEASWSRCYGNDQPKKKRIKELMYDEFEATYGDGHPHLLLYVRALMLAGCGKPFEQYTCPPSVWKRFSLREDSHWGVMLLGLALVILGIVLLSIGFSPSTKLGIPYFVGAVLCFLTAPLGLSEIYSTINSFYADYDASDPQFLTANSVPQEYGGRALPAASKGGRV